MEVIEIQMKELDFRQDLEPLIKFFYPNLLVENRVVISVDAKEDAFLLEYYKDGEILSSEKEKVFFSSDNIKEMHKDYRNQIMRALYRILSTVTGKDIPWGVLTGVRPTKLVFERIEAGEAKHVQYLQENFYVSQKKAALATFVAAKEYQLINSIDYKQGYSLYIGIPFCPSICNYCSFGSHPIDKFNHLVEPYIDALIKEIKYAPSYFPKRKLQTVYIGGGTPTSISAEQLRSVIRTVKESFDMSNVIEFTVEAGRPDSITEDKLKMLKDEGITRISINPQTMVQKTLDIIGRKHKVDDIKNAFHMARGLGFDNINMDLIAGLSGECLDDFDYTLTQIEELDPDSLTVHTLAHKRAARLTTDAVNYEGLVATGVVEMVEHAAQYASSHGYEPYYLYRQKNMTENLENVGYAKKGKECLYNILIMEEQQVILALGAGASSKLVRDGDDRFERVENVKSVLDYINRIDELSESKTEYI